MSFNLFQERKYQTKTKQFINSGKVTSMKMVFKISFKNSFSGSKIKYIVFSILEKVFLFGINKKVIPNRAFKWDKLRN